MNEGGHVGEPRILGKPIRLFKDRWEKPLEKVEVYVVVDGHFAGKIDMEEGKTHAIYENTWAWYKQQLCDTYHVGVFIDRVKTKVEEGSRVLEYRPPCGSNNSPCPTDKLHVDYLKMTGGEVEQMGEQCTRLG